MELCGSKARLWFIEGYQIYRPVVITAGIADGNRCRACLAQIGSLLLPRTSRRRGYSVVRFSTNRRCCKGVGSRARIECYRTVATVAIGASCQALNLTILDGEEVVVVAR